MSLAMYMKMNSYTQKNERKTHNEWNKLEYEKSGLPFIRKMKKKDKRKQNQ